MSSATPQARRGATTATEQRLRGAYYTPPALARVIAEWAVRPNTDRVLDPACGDGALLSAACAQLKALRIRHTSRRLYGIEIDSSACARARKNLQIRRDQIRNRDFFDTTLADLSERRFDAVIGNPPYVR